MSGAARDYSPAVRELFRRLPGAGDLVPGPGAVVRGEAEAVERGAWVRFEARVHEGRFADCAFRAWGCPHTLAAAAQAAESLRGAALDAAPAADARRLAAAIGAPAEKLGRLLVVEDALASLVGAARAVQS